MNNFNVLTKEDNSLVIDINEKFENLGHLINLKLNNPSSPVYRAISADFSMLKLRLEFTPNFITENLDCILEQIDNMLDIMGNVIDYEFNLKEEI